MLLAVDIGNTNVVIGCFEKEKLEHQFRFKTDTARPLDEYAALILSLAGRKYPDSGRISGCIISSVVPLLTPLFLRFSREYLGVEAVTVTCDNAGIDLNVLEPAKVGADRLVNAVAARELYGAPSLVVDFGTATTFDLVGPAGTYEGGVIAPGFSGSLETLVRTTALLPRIELQWPESAIGRTTVSAMQAGVVRGYVCMVDGLIDMIQEESGEIKTIIATGGLGGVITEHSKRISVYSPDLTIMGMLLIAKKTGMV